MLTYEIKTDISEQQSDYLKLLLGITGLISIHLFALELALKQNSLLMWYVLFGTVLISNFLRLKRHFQLSAWVFLVGLLAAFVVRIFTTDLNPGIFPLMLIPVALTTMLLDRNALVSVAVLTILTMIAATTIKANLLVALNMSFTSTIVCGVIALASHVNAGNIAELIYWATDSQKKDANRAEAFYQQSEQLREALLKLSHANSKQEQLNNQLNYEKRKVEQISRAKSVFLSNMSHELRTPLNVVIGYTSSMLTMPQMFDDVELPAVYHKYIQLIKDNGHYLIGLINDILDLSKIEAGKLELHQEVVELTTIFKGVIATSVGLIKNKPVQIKPDFPDELPLVWADPLRVRQIILNLMSNAIKFTSTGSVTLSASIEPNFVRIAVIDTGIGIPDYAVSKIFDRFQQAELDTDKVYGGTGLGLDISKQLAVMHGSDLTVESTVGAGSIFIFKLPLATQEQTGITIMPEVTARNGHYALLESSQETVDNLYTVLLAEDEVSTRELMRQTLEGQGYVVLETHDGAQVFDLAIGTLPDAIILDINLPNVSGLDIISALKTNAETSAIPVIVCTVADARPHAMEFGASIYLQKPLVPADILKAVQDVLLPVAEKKHG